jgi:hypothetical protein
MDYFFRTDKFSPGQTLPAIAEDYGDKTEATVEGIDKSIWPGPEKSTPKAEATLLFVQFMDGSTWGTPGSVMTLRRQALSYFQNLSKQNDQELTSSLSDPAKMGSGPQYAIAHRLHHLMITSGLSAAREKIASCLQMAAERAYLLK